MNRSHIAIAIVSLCLAPCSWIPRAHADIVINAIENNGNVTFSYTGKLNTATLGADYSWQIVGEVDPANSELYFGGSNFSPDNSVRYYYTAVASSPSSFGTGNFDIAAAYTGSYFGITPFTVILPSSYNGTSTLTGTVVFSGENFSTLGIDTTRDPYVWTLENGEKITLYLGAIPGQGSSGLVLKRKMERLKFQLSKAKKAKNAASIRRLKAAIAKLKRQISAL